jgi:hypothetical protein
MKTFTLVLFVVLCSAFTQAKEKPNPADFTVKVHISAAHFVVYPSTTYMLYADAILNGRKLQLAGRAALIQSNYLLITPGDYPARLIKDVHNTDGTAIHQEYELLLTDGITWDCVISGVSE